MKPETRRHFISRSLPAVGLAAGCVALGNSDLGKVKGRVIRPGELEYEKGRRVFYWNEGTERRPRMIVRCVVEDDVRQAVEFARRNGLEVAVRAGGHAHLGWGCSDGVVIDLSGMKRIEVDVGRRVARCEGGVLSGEVAREAGRFGFAPVLGQCPGVGATGATLGGGLGWLSGLFGASCDNLISARVVTADGRVVAADEKRNADLFWALRGAGGNFGVTTSFELRLHPVGIMTGGDVHYAAKDARVVLRFFRELMDGAPDGFQATLNLTQSERGVFVSFCSAGSESETEKILREMRKIATPTKEFVARQEFSVFAERPAATNQANVAPPAFRGIQTVYRDRLSDELIDVVVERFERAGPEVVFGISHYMHGAVCRVDPSATAFSLREPGALNVRMAYSWNDAATGKRLNEWAGESLRVLRPAVGEKVYANFQTYEAASGAKAVFGVNFARVAALKRKFDPENFFRRNSNVPPLK